MSMWELKQKQKVENMLPCPGMHVFFEVSNIMLLDSYQKCIVSGSLCRERGHRNNGPSIYAKTSETDIPLVKEFCKLSISRMLGILG